MQVKIIIGTVAFMLTMILMGFYSLLEPQRMQNFTDARLGRQIEAGAELYYANCTTCHGLNGMGSMGGECYNAAGEPIGCQGRPLNWRGLLCGEPSARMAEHGWGGTKDGFVNGTLTTGRPGGIMVAWSQAFGGPLQENEIENLTKFILNWETEEMCSFIPLEFPWPEGGDSPDPVPAYEELFGITLDDVVAANPDFQEEIAIQLPLSYDNADAERGKDLYENVYACTACHGQPEGDASTANAGPWHGDLHANASERVAGVSAQAYVYQSVLYPDSFYVPGYESGGMASYISQMNDSPQDLLDIMKYLLEAVPANQ